MNDIRENLNHIQEEEREKVWMVKPGTRTVGKKEICASYGSECNVDPSQRRKFSGEFGW